MLFSTSKIDYSSVHRMPTVKLSAQTQGSTTNTMPTSTSLQDVSSHHTQKYTWNDNNNDQRLINFSEKLTSSNTGRQLSISHSDDRIFEHPEVTIKPSALDDEIQRRLLTIKTSNANENVIDREGRSSEPNILEHPDMRSPVTMQPQQLSSSSSALLINNDDKRIIRQQSADVYTTMARTPSPANRVEFFIDNNENSIRSTSPGSLISDIIESPKQDKNEDHRLSLPTKKDSTQMIHEYSEISSKSNIYPTNKLQTKKNDSW